jgi:hypothetical protein
MIDVVLDVSGIYGLGPSHEAIRAAANAAKGKDKSESFAVAADTLTSEVPAEDLEEEIVDQDSAYDSESASVIRLSNGMVGKAIFCRRHVITISKCIFSLNNYVSL